MVVYTDASCGNLKNGGSQEVYLIFLMEEDNFCNLLSWESKQLKRVTRSSLTAETIALLDGVEAALYMKEHFKELYKRELYKLASRSLHWQSVTFRCTEIVKIC